MLLASGGMWHAMIEAHTEVGEFKEAIHQLQADKKEVIDRLARIEQATQDLKEEENRQREWRERVEYFAERPIQKRKR